MMKTNKKIFAALLKTLFTLSALFSVTVTAAIILTVLTESIHFFHFISPPDFLFGLRWSPQLAIRPDQVGSSGAFGIVPLFAGTFLIMLIAMAVAVPVGLFS